MKSLPLITAFFFLMGLAWSFSGGPKLGSGSPHFQNKSIQVLYLKGSFAPPKAQSLNLPGLEVSYEAVDTPSQWRRLIFNGQSDYDVLIGYAWAAQELEENFRIKNARFSSITNYTHISTDFLNLAYDRNGNGFLPLLWHTREVSEPQHELWVSVGALGHRTKNPKEALKYLNALLEPNEALRLAKATGHRTVLKDEVFLEPPPPGQRASYLRNLKLSELSLPEGIRK